MNCCLVDSTCYLMSSEESICLFTIIALCVTLLILVLSDN